MNQEKIFQAEVTDVSHKGLGVVQHPNGMKYFVPGVWPGDVGEFEMTQIEKRYGFARLVRLVRESAERVPVVCPHFGFSEGQCGGCSWLMVSYSAQLQMKKKILHTQLLKNKIDLSSTELFDVAPAEKKLGYRTRAQLKTNGQQVGYVTPNSKTIAPIADCLVLSEHNRLLLSQILKKRSQWPQPDIKKFLFNFFDIDDDLALEELDVNKRRPFRQGHAEQNELIKKVINEWLGASSAGSLLELFCGSGNFTEALSHLNFEKILALEFDAGAIKNLKDKNLKNVQAEVANLYLPKTLKRYRQQIQDVKVLVLDPPREGFEGLAQWVKECPALQKILYISCDVSTFARDVSQLQSIGWRLERIQPVDMFPQTPHVELISYLSR